MTRNKLCETFAEITQIILLYPVRIFRGSLLSSSRDIKAVQSRVQQTLDRGVQIDLSTEPCNRYLRRHVNRKVAAVILYVDIDGSTKLSMAIPTADFASILHIFSQEMTLVISELGGYTLKYVGDAVIALFPAQFDKVQASENAMDCAKQMHDIIKRGINPQLTTHGLPELRVKISIDFGEVQVVLYGKSLERSHIDVIGSSISTAAKMIAFAASGQTIVGQRMFEILSEIYPQDNFVKLDADTSKWSHVREGEGKYSLYMSKVQ